mmetsp:Transcript_9310/g.24007  ORF Transcript_9310/g.24007 Transcript_9310/m.24007 type:complete len:248 (+) Transcript_9310:1016-1759(+)
MAEAAPGDTAGEAAGDGEGGAHRQDAAAGAHQRHGAVHGADDRRPQAEDRDGDHRARHEPAHADAPSGPPGCPQRGEAARAPQLGAGHPAQDAQARRRGQGGAHLRARAGDRRGQAHPRPEGHGHRPGVEPASRAGPAEGAGPRGAAGRGHEVHPVPARDDAGRLARHVTAASFAWTGARLRAGPGRAVGKPHVLDSLEGLNPVRQSGRQEVAGYEREGSHLHCPLARMTVGSLRRRSRARPTRPNL